ncbi:MAG: DUF3293 domain-containing protein [Akkermansiaceae bacterium]|jgi:hypothetical protein
MNFFLETVRRTIRCGLAQPQSRDAITPQARKELLTRLLKLNHERTAVEVAKEHHPGFLKARFHPLSPGHFTHDIMTVSTAENLGGLVQASEENQLLSQLLADELQTRDIPATAFAVGAVDDGSHLEQSFLVATNLETAVEIGKKFGQVAMFMVYLKERVEIVTCGGQGKHHLGLLSRIVVWPPLVKTTNNNNKTKTPTKTQSHKINGAKLTRAKREKSSDEHP